MSTIKLKPLHYLAMKMVDVANSAEDTRRRDLSAELVREFEMRIERGNLINVQIRGEQTSGKSIVGFTISKYVNKLLKKDMTIKRIAPDQIDFIAMIKNTSRGDECILIDEWNEMSTTGYNSSTNQALLTYFNEVQAQRFIHKVACSPEKIIDPTARIILEVLEKSIKQQFTRCLVYYVVYKDGIRIEQPLGYVDIDVSKSIKDKSYLAYRKRKFKKMQMLWEDKILDNRAIEEAKIVLAVVEKMQSLAKDCQIVQKDIIRNYISIVQDELVAMSILGEEKLVSTIYGVLMYLKNVASVNKKVATLEKAIARSVENPEQAAYLEMKKEILDNARNDLVKQYKQNIERYERIIKKAKEFESMDEKSITKNEKERKGGALA